MHARFLSAICAGLLPLVLVSTVEANSLASRLGGLAYYDDTLDITWLADANAGAGSAFDDGFSSTDGLMTWASANAWAASLNINGVTGWRLPTMMDTGAPGCDFAYTGTDCGYNVQTGSAATTVYSEMASLWYDTLGNLAYYDTAGNGSQPGWGLTNTGPFSNVQSGRYWSGTVFAINPNDAWNFNTFFGIQDAYVKDSKLFAWAVRSGDVSVVPIPAAAWLFGSGLIGLLAVARRKASPAQA